MLFGLGADIDCSLRYAQLICVAESEAPGYSWAFEQIAKRDHQLAFVGWSGGIDHVTARLVEHPIVSELNQGQRIGKAIVLRGQVANLQVVDHCELQELERIWRIVSPSLPP